MAERFESNKTRAADESTDSPNFDVVTELAGQRPLEANRAQSSGMADFPPEVQLGARQLAYGLAHAADDNAAREQFTQFAHEFKSYNSFALGLAINTALKEEGISGWGVSANNQGRMWLERVQPERPDEILMKGQFFKPGEDTDAEFEPNETQLASIANRFAGGVGRLSQPELTASLNSTLEEMKRAGAGPKDAQHAINDAFESSNTDLRVYITPRGKIELYREAPNIPPVAEVELNKL